MLDHLFTYLFFLTECLSSWSSLASLLELSVSPTSLGMEDGGIVFGWIGDGDGGIVVGWIAVEVFGWIGVKEVFGWIGVKEVSGWIGVEEVFGWIGVEEFFGWIGVEAPLLSVREGATLTCLKDLLLLLCWI